MIIKIGKKTSVKNISDKLKKAASTKEISWDKYFRKIKFPGKRIDIPAKNAG